MTLRRYFIVYYYPDRPSEQADVIMRAFTAADAIAQFQVERPRTVIKSVSPLED